MSEPSHDHDEIARRLWNGIAQANTGVLYEILDPKAVWHMPGESPIAGTYVGREEIVGFMARIGELTDELESDLVDIFTNDSGAVIRYRIRALRGPETLDTEHLFLIRTEGGRIVEGLFAPMNAGAYDRFFRSH